MTRSGVFGITSLHPGRLFLLSCFTRKICSTVECRGIHLYLRTIYRLVVNPYLCETMDIIFGRVMKATAVAINRERAMNTIADAIILIERVERVLNVIAVVVIRERVLKAIAVTMALLIIGIALPSVF